jgi:hypothetical protein
MILFSLLSPGRKDRRTLSPGMYGILWPCDDKAMGESIVADVCALMDCGVPPPNSSFCHVSFSARKVETLGKKETYSHLCLKTTRSRLPAHVAKRFHDILKDAPRQTLTPAIQPVPTIPFPPLTAPTGPILQSDHAPYQRQPQPRPQLRVSVRLYASRTNALAG